jgi:hypothetical protein
MIIYFLGVITGLGVATFLVVVDFVFKRKVNSQGITASLTKKTHRQAEICEPLGEELTNFINNLKKE